MPRKSRQKLAVKSSRTGMRVLQGLGVMKRKIKRNLKPRRTRRGNTPTPLPNKIAKRKTKRKKA